MRTGPPVVAEWLLRRLLAPKHRDAILGDLMEQYSARRPRGAVRAAMWYWRQVAQVMRTRMARGDARDAFSFSEGAMTDGIRQDLRFAFRMLWRVPAFTVVAVMTLALGIGATTAIVSVTYDLIVRPLPYEAPDDLVALWPNRFVAYQDVDVIRERSTAFRGVEVISPGWSVAVTGIERPTQLEGARVSAGLFDLLGVSAERGRPFLPGEDAPDGPAVALISYEAWRDVFGADPNAVGRRVTLDGTPTEIVGIMPPGFEIIQSGAELWQPLVHDRDAFYYRGSALLALARLNSGISLESAGREFAVSVAGIREAFGYSEVYVENTSLVSLHEAIVGDIRPTMLLLVGASIFILLIAGANLANLLLARAAFRSRELAMRAALGASRRRLVRQLMTESVVLTGVGVTMGSLLAVWGVRSLAYLLPAGTPRVNELAVHGPLLAGAALMSGLIAAGFGLLPAWSATRQGAAIALRAGERTTGDGGTYLRQGVVVIQIAVAFVLVVGAGLMVQSLWRLTRVDPGFRTSGILTARVQPATYDTVARRAAYYRDLFDRIAALPGVEAVGAIQHLPLTNFGWTTRLELPDQAVPEHEQPRVGWRIVNEAYFDAMGVALQQGRNFTRDDTMDRPPVVIISQEAARRFWPDSDPVGRPLRAGNATRNEWATIVGVVGSVRHSSLDVEPGPEIYRPVWQYVQGVMALAIRTSVPPASLAGPVRQTIWSVDNDVPIADMRTMEQIVTASVESRRVLMVLLALFAGVGTMLGGIGIYGVIAYGVSQRRREFGLRTALGAQQRRVVAMVVRQGMRLVVVGVGIGLAGALALARTMEGFVFGVRPTDPGTLAALAGLVAAIAAVACAVPAWRAGRISPMTALRSD